MYQKLSELVLVKDIIPGWGKQIMHNRALRGDAQAAASVMVVASGTFPSIGSRTTTVVPLPSRE